MATRQPCGMGADWTNGKTGGAIHTDGIDDLIRISPASFDFSRHITVATWIKEELTGGNRGQATLLVAMDSAGARKFAVLLDSNNKRFCIQTTNLDSCTNFDTYTVVGSWFHFVLTKSATSVRIFVNGSPVGSDLVHGECNWK